MQLFPFKKLLSCFFVSEYFIKINSNANIKKQNLIWNWLQGIFF
jgi:hypothetical protein